MGRKGRKRTAAAMDDITATAGVLPYRALAGINMGLGARLSQQQRAKNACAADKAFEGTTTERYGALFKDAGGLAPAQEGDTLAPIQYVDPFVLLEYLCIVSPCFARFLGRCVGTKTHGDEAQPVDPGDEAQPVDPTRVVLYHDDVRPGNVHRPGFGRLFCCVYWTLSAFPDWFRQSDDGWFTLCIYPRGFIDSIRGGVSALFAAMLRVFYPPEGVNFERTGLALPDGRGAVMYFKAEFAGVLADEKALAETADGKGASSNKSIASGVATSSAVATQAK